MRRHVKTTRPPPDRPPVTPIPIDPDLVDWLLYDADFETRPSTWDYWSCCLCGAAGGWGECIACAKPDRPNTRDICWSCLVGILMVRGAVVGDGDYVPARIGNGVQLLDLAVTWQQQPAFAGP